MRPERRLKRRNGGGGSAAPKRRQSNARETGVDDVQEEPMTIYVALLNEGTDCWRPVMAKHVSDDLFQIADPQPEDEEWEFKPGQVVRCKERTFQSGSGLGAFESIDR
jgi:hypothetical protein